MEFQGTKGNWYLQKYTDAYTNIIRCNDGIHETIYIGSTCQSSSPEIRFNALLMSKAPEMLESLKELVSYLEAIHGAEDTECVEMIRAKELIKESTELKK